MARKPRTTSNGDTLIETADYRHPGKRKNIPPAKMERQGTVPKAERAKYHYNPHLPPELRFDPTASPDKLPALIAAAQKRPLTEAETKALAEALKNQQPWLEWAGKKEEHDRETLSVNPVALHLHERISAKAIVRAAMRQDVERSLFAAAEDDYTKAVQFYKHDVDWANRLILGDSLEVMSSLARREGLAGKVQMIYMDPPYGIKFKSNFQPEVAKREMADNNREQDLTREAEMVRAYRDTWHLGIHSYLSYLRDRFVTARELLADSGSMFVQISDEHLHRVRAVLDEVFGADNAVSVITIRKTTSEGRSYLGATADYLLWYARDVTRTKYRTVYLRRSDDSDDRYDQALCNDGQVRPASEDEAASASVTAWPLVFRMDNITSSRSSGEGDVREFVFEGRRCDPGSGTFKSNMEGLGRLSGCHRLQLSSKGKLNYRRGKADFGVSPVANLWADISGAVQSRSDPKVYAVQTSTSVVERCLLLSTDPGDLVVDPTCGSGTTAYVAEQWGRRWITTDSSRVACAIARQRLLTARFDYYRTRSSSMVGAGGSRKGVGGPTNGAAGSTTSVQGAGTAVLGDSVFSSGPDNPARGFIYKTVPHIELGKIAQNPNLDPIFAKHEPLLDKALAACNAALRKVSKDLAARLAGKLAAKQRDEGKRAITDADRRRWVLPPANRDPKTKYTVDAALAGWYHWEVPFDIDTDWPRDLQDAVSAYRNAWRAKMDEVNGCIAKSAEQEELVDQPEVVRGVTRVTGPFTVEGVIPEEMALTEEGIKDLTPNDDDDGDAASDLQNIHAYLRGMVDAIRGDGLTFPNNKKGTFAEVTPLYEGGALDALHAEGFWSDDSKKAEPVAIAFGPQYGPITARQVEDCIHAATRYRHLVLAGFSFAPEAAAIVAEQSHPKLKIHLANIRPDMNPAMKGLLKETPNSQLFSVFGLPEIEVKQDKDGKHIVTLKGVDIFDPVENTVRSTGASKVAAWFLDSDFDNRCFCTTQAFFPNQDAWGKIAKALGSAGNEEAFEAFKGTESLPFEAGEHKRVAVKVIDPRGNEVMTVRKLS